MQTLLSIWAWACITLIIIAGFFVYLAVFLVTYPFDRDRLIVGRMWRLSAVLASKLNPMWRFRVTGALPRTRPRAWSSSATTARRPTFFSSRTCPGR
jgi:1-acyl-sn-glycerol-3-phosphate acyltransferase